jgi:hypothetical protein
MDRRATSLLLHMAALVAVVAPHNLMDLVRGQPEYMRSVRSWRKSEAGEGSVVQKRQRVLPRRGCFLRQRLNRFA